MAPELNLRAAGPARSLLALLIAALACGRLQPPAVVTPAPAAAAQPATLPLASTPSAPTPTPSVEAGAILVHPGPQLYSGDLVSLAVAGPPEWLGAVATIFLDGPEGRPLASGPIVAFGLGGRAQATFWWAWDTAGLAGAQSLTAVVAHSVGGAPLATLTQTVELRPAGERPEPEPRADWAQSESACCIFHYLTGTAAARDIAQIEAEADRAFARTADKLEVAPAGKAVFTLLSRLIGQGGFTNSEIYLTYTDRNPAGLDLPTALAHEAVHLLDREITTARPAFLAEGLAVYLAGGHYRPEDLDRSAAALLSLGRYLPLPALARDFYPAQHEIGYLEAGAFVKYLVDRFGWERFRGLYASFEAGEDESAMLSDGLRSAYGLPLEALEADWLSGLRARPPDPEAARLLQLKLNLYEAVRGYQQQDDPDAYFLTAWLPDGPTARRLGASADFVRSPRAAENIALEVMLTEAEAALAQGRAGPAQALIESVEAVLAAGGQFADPLAARYLRSVAELAARGYEAQRIDLDGAAPRAVAVREWPTLETVPLYNSGP